MQSTGRLTDSKRSIGGRESRYAKRAGRSTPFVAMRSQSHDVFWRDGNVKGINFSLSVAIELARRMRATAREGNERSVAINLLGAALATLGERESGTARLEEAVA